MKASRVETLHPAGLAVAEHYAGLNLGGKRVAAPYFMNEPGRKGLRVRVGKGTPRALEQETIRLARKHNFDLAAASPEQIRSFMIDHRLGIDCSGLVSWVSFALAQNKRGRRLWRDITFKGHPARRMMVRWAAAGGESVGSRVNRRPERRENYQSSRCTAGRHHPFAERQSCATDH